MVVDIGFPEVAVDGSCLDEDAAAVGEALVNLQKYGDQQIESQDWSRRGESAHVKGPMTAIVWE